MWLTIAGHTPLVAATPAPAYLVDASKIGEGSVSITLDLPAALPTGPSRIEARKLLVGSAPRVSEIACNGVPLERDGAGWALTSDCRSVSWTVNLPPTSSDIAADDQSGLASEMGWGILPDTAFLRHEAWSGEASARIVGDGAPARNETLPALDSAPALFLIGNPPTAEASGDGIALTYVGERLDEVLARISPDEHLAALSYLRPLTGTSAGPDRARFIVVWLPALRSKRGLVGAAGANAMLVNYYPDTERPSPAEALMPFVILLHEQFHQLAPGGLPLWASESLAQYFALKAATRTARGGEAIASLWRQLASTPRDTPGLLEVQRQVVERRGTSNYGLFYSRGAMFWHELDLALQRTSGGARTLDEVMPLLFESGFDADGNLSASLLTALQPIPDRELESLIDRYLGS